MQGRTSPGGRSQVPHPALCCDRRAAGRGVTDQPALRSGSLAFATVHLRWDGDGTTFLVHGSGLIIGRIVNELGIARTVTATIKETFRSVPAS